MIQLGDDFRLSIPILALPFTASGEMHFLMGVPHLRVTQ
jgi:hypothetical protein